MRPTPSSKRSSKLSDTQRAALARSVGLGGAMLPVFGLLDLFAHLTLYPEANLLLVFALRGWATLVAAGAYWVGKSARFSDTSARVTHALCLACVAAALTGMAYQFGGPSSVYMHGLSIVAMVRFAIVPARMSDAMLHGLLILLVYLLGFALLYLLDSTAHAAWLAPSALSTFAIQYAMVGATITCGALASHGRWAAQEQLYQARKLGRYRLEAPIGQGGQNEVWLAWDGNLKRNVALKILRSSHASASAILLFEREATLASRLESPHTVRVYDFGASDDGIYYLAMEHLVGSDLSALVKAHGPMPAERAVHFAMQACLSLEEAHAAGLVHRDIKPSNLFAAQVGGRYDVLKLLDFGIARSLHDTDSELTRTGVVRGTPAYLAPECCRGESATPIADLYGLGATLYHLLTGRPPFEGETEHVLAQQMNARLSLPGQRLGQALPRDLEAVVMRCLEKAPEQRYRSARELYQALASCASAHQWSDEDAFAFWRQSQLPMQARFEAETLV